MPGPVLFGKIPARADFVRRGEASPAVDAIDDLSQRALRSRPPERDGPLYRAVLVPPRGPHVVVGALRLSRDTVGRTYPLVAGRTALRAAADPATTAAWPLRWAPVFGEAAGLIEAARLGASLEDLDRRLTHLPTLAPTQGRSAEVDTHVRSIRALSAQALWARTWGEPDPTRVALIASRLVRERGPIPFGLRFCLPPPAPDFRRGDAVALWLAVCWYLLPPPSAPPTVLWTDGPPGALYVFFGPVAPAAFRAVLAGVPDPDRILSVDDGPASARVRAASDLPSPFGQLLDDPYASVADVLDQLHTLR